MANGLSHTEHIPDTYRDDLLREISLMKSIGQHINIVSMVGACTARQPIALIMEYVPYGNLQNFLKLVAFIDVHRVTLFTTITLAYVLVDFYIFLYQEWILHNHV